MKNVPENLLYAVVDFDNTCIHNDIGIAVFNYMCRFHTIKNTDKTPQEIFLTYHKLHDDNKILEAYKFCAKILSGYKEKEIKKLVEDTVVYEGNILTNQELYGKIIPKGLKVNIRTHNVITNLLKKKIKIYIVSASSEIIVKTLLKLWFSDWDVICIGVRNEIKNGIVTKDLVKPIPGYEGKVDCIKKYIDPEIRPVIAVGDSKNDLPMLEYAEIKIVVGDKLTPYIKKAENENWYQL